MRRLSLWCAYAVLLGFVVAFFVAVPWQVTAFVISAIAIFLALVRILAEHTGE